MTTADSSQHSLAYVKESTFGTTPASPTLTPLRHSGATLGVEKTLLESQEVNSSRDVKYIRHGNKQVGRDVSFELSYGSQDDFLASALGDSWSTEVDTGEITIDVDASGSSATFTRSSGDFTSDPIAVGDVVTSSGYSAAGGNGRFLVTAVTSTVVTATPLEGQTIPTETGDGDERLIVRATIKNDTTQDSYTIQRYFSDVGDYVVLTGMVVDTLGLEIGTDAMVTGTLSFIGKDITTDTSAISGSSTSAETTTEGFDTYTGSIYENGATGACATTLSMSIANSVSRNFCVFEDTANSLTSGKFRATGTMTVYFEDLSFYDKFIDETETSIAFTLTDPAGNSFWVYLPSVKYNAGNPDTSAEGSVTLALDFQATNDDDADCTMMIQRTAA